MEVKKILVEKNVFVAFDGTEFETLEECNNYELIKNGKRKKCLNCNGLGEVNDYDTVGEGKLLFHYCIKMKTCKKCNGKGYLELKEVWV